MLLALSFAWREHGRRFSRCRFQIERLADVVDAQTEQPDDSQPIALPPIRGKVEFENVCFRFNPHAPLLLNQ